MALSSANLDAFYPSNGANYVGGGHYDYSRVYLVLPNLSPVAQAGQYHQNPPQNRQYDADVDLRGHERGLNLFQNQVGGTHQNPPTQAAASSVEELSWGSQQPHPVYTPVQSSPWYQQTYYNDQQAIAAQKTPLRNYEITNQQWYQEPNVQAHENTNGSSSDEMDQFIQWFSQQTQETQQNMFKDLQESRQGPSAYNAALNADPQPAPNSLGAPSIPPAPIAHAHQNIAVGPTRHLHSNQLRPLEAASSPSTSRAARRDARNPYQHPAPTNARASTSGTQANNAQPPAIQVPDLPKQDKKKIRRTCKPRRNPAPHTPEHSAQASMQSTFSVQPHASIESLGNSTGHAIRPRPEDSCPPSSQLSPSSGPSMHSSSHERSGTITPAASSHAYSAVEAPMPRMARDGEETHQHAFPDGGMLSPNNIPWQVSALSPSFSLTPGLTAASSPAESHGILTPLPHAYQPRWSGEASGSRAFSPANPPPNCVPEVQKADATESQGASSSSVTVAATYKAKRSSSTQTCDTIRCPFEGCLTELNKSEAWNHYRWTHKWPYKNEEPADGAATGKMHRCPFKECRGMNVTVSKYPHHIATEHIAKQSKRGWEDKIRDPKTGKVVHRDQVQGGDARGRK